MKTDKEVWRHQNSSGLMRICWRKTSRGKGAGKAIKFRAEYHSSHTGFRSQMPIGKQMKDRLMSLNTGNRVFWIRKIATNPNGKEMFVEWINDAVKRSVHLEERDVFEHAETHGVDRIFSGGLPSLGKNN